jgi:hypothetical protein
MEIKYLKSLANNPTLAGWKNKGYTLEEIEELDHKCLNGIMFPKAYK